MLETLVRVPAVEWPDRSARRRWTAPLLVMLWVAVLGAVAFAVGVAAVGPHHDAGTDTTPARAEAADDVGTGILCEGAGVGCLCPPPIRPVLLGCEPGAPDASRRSPSAGQLGVPSAPSSTSNASAKAS